MTRKKTKSNNAKHDKNEPTISNRDIIKTLRWSDVFDTNPNPVPDFLTRLEAIKHTSIGDLHLHPYQYTQLPIKEPDIKISVKSLEMLIHETQLLYAYLSGLNTNSNKLSSQVFEDKARNVYTILCDIKLSTESPPSFTTTTSESEDDDDE